MSLREDAASMTDLQTSIATLTDREIRGEPDGNSLYYYSLWMNARIENERLRRIEEHAGLMRDAIEGLATGDAMRAETVRASIRLIVKAYDEGSA